MTSQHRELECATLRILVDAAPPRMTVQLRGELDMACAGLVDSVAQSDFTGITSVTVDLTGLTFLDSTGMQALLVFKATHEDEDRDVRLAHPNPNVRRIFAVLGLDDFLTP